MRGGRVAAESCDVMDNLAERRKACERAAEASPARLATALEASPSLREPQFGNRLSSCGVIQGDKFDRTLIAFP